MKKHSFRAAVFALIVGGLLTQVQAQDRTLIHAGHLITGVDDSVRRQVTLVIEGGTVAAIRDGFQPAGAQDRLIDLSAEWVMPGFIDLHTHVSSQTEKGGYIKNFQLYPADVALRAVPYLRRTLEAGFTTARNLGSRDHVSVALRDAVNLGVVPGPRLFVAATSLAVLGGHADRTNSYREDIVGIPTADEGIVNGPESARRATLLAIKRGADVIKITSTAGVLSLAGRGDTPQFTEGEIRVIVNTARDFGLKVAAHAHGAEGMKRAIRAGVATIEHGTFMDDEVMRLMKEHGVYWVPTLSAGDAVVRYAGIEGYYSPLVVPKALRIGAAVEATFRKALAEGVPIAFGTDAGVFPHGENAREFELMVAGGMTPIEAIRTATYHAARALGREEALGTLAPGMPADVVAVSSSPLDDISVLRSIDFVMKEGTVYKDARKGAPSGE